MITLIAARARNAAIGRAGDIPWHAPEDLAMFKRETLGGALIMGRKTWESLPVKPLKSRLNVVVTSNPGLCDHTAPDIATALRLCHDQGYFRIYGIGGQSIYQALLPLAHRMLITEVDLVIEKADAFFPEFDEQDWREIGNQGLREQEPRCVVRELVRGANFSQTECSVCTSGLL
ncbi:dihydrofolate reductase [Tropicibacter oceani]|uniref:Dihydrofolate reductase n=1 Tax=Tropicibacter oceani TaxID=3058420 RepID=A0ABY8QMV4_9RHOB|nr:dihydrofolate reductase [Tropicibacter oceani]WGW05432.1 dihydrofolate reductase [Tropicibacter oceani]